MLKFQQTTKQAAASKAAQRQQKENKRLAIKKRESAIYRVGATTDSKRTQAPFSNQAKFPG